MGDNGNGKEWWEDEVLLFSCKQCGGCCEKKGILLWSDVDIKKASTYLEMPEDTFKKVYLKESKGSYLIVNSRKKPCPFLTKEKTCRIQDAKPQQCKNYPFWPHILQTKQSWNTEKFFCKGIGHGKEVKPKDFIPDQKVLSGMKEDELAEIMAIMDCGTHYKKEEDGMCRSTECAFAQNEHAAQQIKERGCAIYLHYLRLEKGEDKE